MMSLRRRDRGGLALLVTLAVLSMARGAVAAERVVAIGDIHGAYPQLVEILRRSGLVDEELHWSGGASTLVQVGDMLDRGSQPREVMDLLRRLQEEAPRSGGRVVVLLGNHEAMNIVGDLRYVTPEIYGEFADAESPRRREVAWNAWQGLVAGWAQRDQQPVPEVTPAMEQEFDARHPLGYFEYRAAMGPSGEYGRWLRSLPAAARIDDTIYLHGGLSPELPMDDVDELNRAVARELEQFDRDVATMERLGVALPWFTLPERTALVRRELAVEAGQASALGTQDRLLLEQFEQRWTHPDSTLTMGANGPLWFRGYARWNAEEGTAAVAGICLDWGAAHLVVGHSPTGAEGRIASRFGGRVLLVDTGMLPGHYEGGQPSALELAAGGLEAIYPDGEAPPVRLDVDAPPGAAPVGRIWMGAKGNRLPFHDDAEILEFLRIAEIVDSKETDTGINHTEKLTLERGEVVAHAAFRTVDEEKLRKELPTGTVLNFKDSYRSEVAAYRLSRLLGMDEVPPAVLRELHGQEGSVQLWIEDAQMEVSRRKEHGPLPNARVWLELYDMRVFDNLIGNIDRNQGNILYDRMGRLWLIDHTRSLSRSPTLPDKGAIEKCSLRLWRRLQSLDMAGLEAELSDVLSTGEMKAVLKRRDAVLGVLQKAIERRGRDDVLFDLDRDAGRIKLVQPSRPRADGNVARSSIELDASGP